MESRAWIATRKGLFELVRGGGTWRLGRVSFLAEPVSMLLPPGDDGRMLAALNLGHYGVKVHASDDAGASWHEVATPSYPEQPADAPAAATPEAADAAEAATTTLTPKKLECRPGQKEKVTAAINNYVKSTGVTLPEEKAPPAAEAPAPKAENQPQSSENPPALAPVPLAPVAGSAN